MLGGEYKFMELLASVYDFLHSSQMYSIYISPLKLGMKFDTHVK
jgi:hypothetical protein